MGGRTAFTDVTILLTIHVPASLVRTEPVVKVVVLTVHDVASGIWTKEEQWKLLKVRHKAVIISDGHVRHTYVWAQQALVGLLRRGLVLGVEASTGKQDVIS